MEGIGEFIRGMTFWNWIALIAFIFFPLSALNAFLSLKSRYLDWQGTKSKQAFENRLRQLEVQIFVIGEYRKQPAIFFRDVLDEGMRPLISFLLSFFVFVMAV
jgi:hypothetical protein